MNHKIGIQTYFFVFLVIFIFSLNGCTWKDHKEDYDKDYKIISITNYNASFCRRMSSSYNAEINKNKPFSSGLKIIAKDNDTGKIVEGDVSIDYIVSNTGFYLTEKPNFTCQENLDSDYAIISIYPKADYSPKVFEFKLLKNKLVTIEVLMNKICEGGKNLFENYEIGLVHKHNNDEEEIREIIEYAHKKVDGFISTFGLNKTDYKLDCIEGSLERGGFIKARGIYLDKTPFELYYRDGFCSSAGTDCGFDACFTSFSDDEGLYELVKSNLCKEIFSYDIKEEHDPNSYTTRRVRVNDTTDEIRKKCLEDGFSKIDDEKKSISIRKGLYPMRSYVLTGETDCLNI